MVRVEVGPGESVRVTFVDSDGEFEIHYDTPEHPNAIVVKETAGLAGNVKGEAHEVMHHEQFNEAVIDEGC